MWQKYKIYLITGLAACWSLLNSACNETYDHKGKTPIVEVDGNFLYKQDLLSAMPPGATGKDSIKFAEEYIRNWVNDVLLFIKAEGNIPDNVKIDELVNSYRRALIMHTYLEELVNQEVGDNVTSSEIEEFYNQNSGAFLAEEPYIRGLYIKVPVNASDISSVRRWYKDNSQSSIDKLEKYGLKYAVDYDYFYDRWEPLTEVSQKFPSKEIDKDPEYLKRNRNYEVSDTAFHYFLHVENFISAGEPLPLEFAGKEIKEMLINMKRVDFITKMKEDLYNQASENNDIKYYNDSNE